MSNNFCIARMNIRTVYDCTLQMTGLAQRRYTIATTRFATTH